MLPYLVFAADSDAQLLKRIKDKAKNSAKDKVEQKIDREIEKKTEQMVENTWNSIFGEQFETTDEKGQKTFTFNSSANVEESYTFDTVTRMEIENFSEDGERDSEMKMYMHFNTEDMYTGTKFESEEMKKEEGDFFIIYDLKNEALVMLMESEDGKFSFAYDWKKAGQFLNNYSSLDDEDGEPVDEEPVSEYGGFDKIGTKTIAGVECQGYLTTTDETKTEVWVTEEENSGFSNLFQVQSQAKQLKGKMPDNYPFGMLMEMTHEDLKRGEKVVMKVTDIDKNANVTYRMSDYPAMSFGDKK